MTTGWTRAGCARLAAGLLLWVGAAAWGAELRPVALAASADQKTIYVAEAGARRIDAVDVASGKVARSLPLAGEPHAVLAARDGTRLFVARGGADGAVDVLDLRSGRVTASTPAGHTPSFLVAGPDDAVLYVGARYTNQVAVISPGAARAAAVIDVPREPVAAVLSADGQRLFVANHLPTGRADADQMAAEITVIDTAKRSVTGSVALLSGSSSLRGMGLTPDGRYVLVTHLLSRFELPTTQVDRGWMNTNALTIVDAIGARRVGTVLLDDVDLGAANPWGVACTADGQRLVVAHAGTHELSVIDLPALSKKLEAKPDPSTDLSFLVGLRERVPTAGKGPRALTVSGSTVWSADYFSDALSRIDLAGASHTATVVPLTEPAKLSPARWGELCFNDAGLCFQKWQSCASCHPDGRADGFNWDLMNDGLGNPRNTKSLLLSPATPPAMIRGVRKDAAEGIRSGFRYILFTVQPDSDADAVEAYLTSMQPEPSPRLAKGKLSEAAQRGQRLFRSPQVGCAECHRGPLHTDQSPHDVGTGQAADEALDTPSLTECWRTAPYLNDGRAATMMDVLRPGNRQDRHGRTAHLPEKQLLDLVEYLLSL